MPVVGEFHTQFWAVSDTFVPPPLSASNGGYPAWQAGVVASTLPFGPLGAWWDVMTAKARWWIALLRGVRRLSFNKRADVKALVDRLVANAPAPKPDVITQVVERVIDRPVEVEVIRETRVEVPVDRVVDRPVDVIREVDRIVDRPVVTFIDKPFIVEKLVHASAIDERIAALDPERKAVVLKSLETVESPIYAVAQAAVRETAVTLGFDRPEAWKDLSRHMKEDQGRTQNVYRHLKAMRRTRDLAGSTLTNPQANLVTELAYQGFALMGK